MKHLYSCTISFGNMSIAENEIFKEVFENFMKSFRCNDFSIERVYENNNPKNQFYYYEVNIDFKNFSRLKLQRFSESLVAFSLFWGFSVQENSFE